jgi:predicted amidophosphoribosyltransferase
MAKGCLYCGPQLPDTAEFCPQCGRPQEDAIRVENSGKIRRTPMAKGCLYCGLQLPDTAEFCPQCGRPIERGLEIRPIQESECDHLRKEMMGKDDLLRQQGFSSDGSGPLAHREEYAHLYCVVPMIPLPVDVTCL